MVVVRYQPAGALSATDIETGDALDCHRLAKGKSAMTSLAKRSLCVSYEEKKMEGKCHLNSLCIS